MKFFPYLTYFLIFGFLCGGEPRLRTLPLWPDLAPGEVEGEVGPEGEKPPKPGEKGILRITNVSTTHSNGLSGQSCESEWSRSAGLSREADMEFWHMSMRGRMSAMAE